MTTATTTRRYGARLRRDGDSALFLDAALAIGRRLVEQALWSAEQCTWEVRRPRPDPEERTETGPADGTIYQGTAGIAFFLGELHRATGDPEVGRTARGAMAHALAQAPDVPNLFGFHSGRVGIAWVAVRLAELFDRPEYRDAARRLLRPLVGQESRDDGLDVIAGAAGAVPACLDVGSKTGWDEPPEIARRLGEHLIDQAHLRPDGWSLSGGNMSGRVANLNGLSHGASGMALALLELARATGDGRFLFAAEMAFLHERRCFDEEESNWPDLRYTEIGEFVYFRQLDELRRAVLDGTLPPYRRRCMAAWCHGSPGIGLARLRAWELTGQEVYREEAEAALRSTSAAIEKDVAENDNYSLCHGIGGNCELPVVAAEILERPELLRPAELAAAHGLKTYEAQGRPWPCGTVGSASDPSLMLGEAGIGTFYLRLADPETPSILLLRPGTEKVTTDPAGFQALARESAAGFFGTTLRAWTRLAPPGPVLPAWEPGAGPLLRTPVEETHEVLAAFLENETGERRQMLADAFEPERVRHQLTLELRDYTRAFLRGLVRPAWDDVDVEGAAFVLAPGVRLLCVDHDWESWLGTSEESPPEDEVFYLCREKDDGICRERIGPMAGLVLERVQETATLDQVVAHVAEAVGLARPDERHVAKIQAQLREMYLAGIVDVADAR